MITKDSRFFEHLTELLTHIEDMVDEAPETVRLWNRVTKAIALSRAPRGFCGSELTGSDPDEIIFGCNDCKDNDFRFYA